MLCVYKAPIKNSKRIMETYIALKIPVCVKAQWYEGLKGKVDGMLTRKPERHIHLTLAFINSTTDVDGISEKIGKIASKYEPFDITFNTVEAFTVSSGTEHIVYLGATHMPEPLTKMVGEIRSAVKETGSQMNSEFKFHVTLFRLDAKKISLENLLEEIKPYRKPTEENPQNMSAGSKMPSFNLTVNNLYYRYFSRGGEIKSWQLERV